MEGRRGGNPRRHPPRTEWQGPRSRRRILSSRTLRSKVLRQVEQREQRVLGDNAGTGQEAEEGMSAHLMSLLRPQLRNLDLLLRTI